MALETTTGRIVDKSVVTEKAFDGDDFYRPAVLYKYTVDGKQYECDQVTSIKFGSDSPYFAKRVLERYDIGTYVTVIYDTENPQEAYLEKGFGNPLPLTPAGVGCLLLIIGVILLFLLSEQGKIILNAFGF